MNKLIWILLLPVISWAQVAPSAKSIESISKSEQKHSFYKTTAAGANFDYDVHYYLCRWNVDPSVSYISGSVKMLFTPTQSVLDTFAFDLSNSLGVDSIYYHGQKATYVHANNRVNIFTNTLNSGVDSIHIYYRGSPSTSGLGTFEISVNQYNTPILWTLSEPYGSSEWWPCKNNLQDKADSMDVFITAPSQYKAASNGLLQSEVIVGNDKITHWKHRYPIATYLICLAVSEYSAFTIYVPNGVDSIPVLNYVYPQDSATEYPQAAKIVEMMEVFDSLFGAYPFENEQYGHCRTGIGGGMEHQTFSFMGSYDYQLMAHEAAHQWFGDKVTCNSWEDIWLNEGFATYLTGLVYEAKAPQFWDLYITGQQNYVTSQPDGSVFCNDTTDVFRIFDPRLSYNKGSSILHQLRWYIGDSAFFAGAYNYLHDPALEYGFSRTGKLISHMELASGRNLKEYFDDWYYGQGHPTYNINYSQLSDTVYVTVNQTQSHSSVSLFEMDLPIALHTTNTITSIRLSFNYNNQSFKIPFSGNLDSLTFDDEHWLLHRNNKTAISIGEEDRTAAIKIFPNPTQETINIESESNYDQISVYNIQGQLMYSSEVKHSSLITINLQLAEGQYVIVLSENALPIYSQNLQILH